MMVRLLRWMLILMIVLVALTGLVVYGAQLPDQAVCLTLSNSSDDLVLYDMQRGLMTEETRYRPSVSYGIPDSAYRVAAYPDPVDHQRARLMLEPLESGESILLEEGVYDDAAFSMASRFQWLKDQQQLAYLWQDVNRRQHLTVFNSVHRSRRSVALSESGSSRSGYSLAGQSADGDYLTLSNLERQFVVGYTLFSIETMQVVSLDPALPPLVSGAWSPREALFAGIAEQPLGEQEERELVIVAPETPESLIRIPLTTEIVQAAAVIWSPDGQSLALAQQIAGREEVGFIFRWYFDFFSPDGGRLQPTVIGKRSQQGETVNRLAESVPGFWSQDGQTWLFLRDDPDDNRLIRLLALDVAAGSEEVVEANLLSSFVPHMFSFPRTSSSAYPLAQSHTVIPDNHRLLLPLWRDNGLTLEYVDYEQNRRLTLVEGAAGVLDNTYFSTRWLFPWDNEHFVIPYTDQAGDTHVRVIRVDDGSLVTDIGGLEQISFLQRMNEGFGFIGQRDGEYHFEIVDFETGAHHSLLTGLSVDSTWNAALSPDREYIVLAINEERAESLLSMSTRLFLLRLADETAQRYDDRAVAYPIWSPDSSMFAYVYREENQLPNIRVVNTQGQIVLEQSLPHRTFAQWSLHSWNYCEATPRL
jgi:hypothetical protein